MVQSFSRSQICYLYTGQIFYWNLIDFISFFYYSFCVNWRTLLCWYQYNTIQYNTIHDIQFVTLQHMLSPPPSCGGKSQFLIGHLTRANGKKWRWASWPDWYALHCIADQCENQATSQVLSYQNYAEPCLPRLWWLSRQNFYFVIQGK